MTEANNGGGDTSGLLRIRDPHGHAKVTYVELFFDLVFVFAITQLSHSLLHHFTLAGLAETIFLTLAIWSVWIYTSWVTNWLNPQATVVRLMMFVLMAAGLVMSASIPDAFGDKGIAFAGAFVFMQVGRSIFMCVCLRGRSPNNYRNFLRITAWLIVSGAIWIAGAFAENGARWALWVAALLVEAAGPSAGFRTPGLGRSATTDWDISPAHMAERCGLFVIIALGESLLVTGATVAELAWTHLTIFTFAVCFVASVAMWWVYFSIAADDASEEFARSDDPGRIARLAYTYLHIPLIVGIILSAVSDEVILSHPNGHVSFMQAVAILGGPAIFLVGNLLFKRVLFDEFLRSHVAGLALLTALIITIPLQTPLALAICATGVLLVVGVWENIYAAQWKTANPGWARGKH